jgi:hypothetical protein
MEDEMTIDWRKDLHHGCGGIDGWHDAFEAALRSGETADIACPCCGVDSLRLEVLVRPASNSRGKAYFWCNRCMWGLTPNACAADPHLPIVNDEPDVPDYRIVQP